MPPRPSHLPHNLERTALQKMSATHGLTLAKLHPAVAKTIAGMVAKGWVEKLADANAGATFRITPAGKAALRAKIPTDDFGRWCPALGASNIDQWPKTHSSARSSPGSARPPGCWPRSISAASQKTDIRPGRKLVGEYRIYDEAAARPDQGWHRAMKCPLSANRLFARIGITQALNRSHRDEGGYA